MECLEAFRLLDTVSRFASIFTCLLALLVASPLCCCAAAKTIVAEESCCCSGGGKEKKHDACACPTQEPRETPDVVLPPHQDLTLSTEAAGFWMPVVLESDLDLRPEWVPSIPWHAPPSQRRALLVSRTL